MVLRNAHVLYIPLHTTYTVEGMRSVLVHVSYVVILLLHAYIL